jgi:transposase InsO family protein
MDQRIDGLLRTLYYDVNQPVAFTSAQALYKEARKTDADITQSKVNEWLSGENTYTLHKAARRRFKRNPIVVLGIDEMHQADLVDMQEFAKENGGFKYLLTNIDCFSKFAWAVPLKTKTGNEVAKALEKIYKDRCPYKLQTDEGGEFINRHTKILFKKYEINHFVAVDKAIKCSIVERFNRTLKSRMFKYFTAKGSRKYVDILQSLLNGYNASKHRSIGMRPIDVNEGNEKAVFNKLYGVTSLKDMIRRKHPKIMTGDTVRMQYKLGPFDKSYYPLWTDKQFKVRTASLGIVKPVYRINEENGNEVKGRQYPEGIQKIKTSPYRIEKIIKRRVRNGVREIFVKWLNHDNSYNSWTSLNNVTSL